MSLINLNVPHQWPNFQNVHTAQTKKISSLREDLEWGDVLATEATKTWDEFDLHTSDFNFDRIINLDVGPENHEDGWVLNSVLPPEIVTIGFDFRGPISRKAAYLELITRGSCMSSYVKELTIREQQGYGLTWYHLRNFRYHYFIGSHEFSEKRSS
jgi:hypothetical protein